MADSVEKIDEEFNSFAHGIITGIRKITPIVFEAQLDKFSRLPDFLLMQTIDLSENEKAELQQAVNKEKKVSIALIIFDE